MEMDKKKFVAQEKIKRWRRKRKNKIDQTQIVGDGVGMRLLQKMGWKVGEGLGKTRSGRLEPVPFQYKMDKRGLTTAEDEHDECSISNKKKRKLNKSPLVLLQEITVNNKWALPVYKKVCDIGPFYRKMYIYKVIVNGIMYQPLLHCRTKFDAKVMAAKYCLQKLGYLRK